MSPAQPSRHRPAREHAHEVVSLLDVDNTLLNNDRVQDDLKDHLERSFGAAAKDRYWAIFEGLRAELGYADYLGALQRYRLEDMHEPRLLNMSSFLVDYPFAERAGLLGAVGSRVLIYIHKEQELDDVAARYPAAHYLMVDDKVRILAAMKALWGERLTTVFVRQGHYAHDPEVLAAYPGADLTVARIGELRNYDLPALLAAARAGREGAENVRV
jgi:hypothetical protein